MSALLTRRSFLAGSLLAPAALAGGGGGNGGAGGSVATRSAGGSVATRSAVVQWSQTLLDAISATKPGPPIAARSIGMVHTAIYDAWANYDRVALGTRLGNQLRRPLAEHTLARKQQALSYAAYRTLLDLFPTEKARFDAQMQALGYDPSNTSTDVSQPSGGAIGPHRRFSISDTVTGPISLMTIRTLPATSRSIRPTM